MGAPSARADSGPDDKTTHRLWRSLLEDDRWRAGYRGGREESHATTAKADSHRAATHTATPGTAAGPARTPGTQEPQRCLKIHQHSRSSG